MNSTYSNLTYGAPLPLHIGCGLVGPMGQASRLRLRLARFQRIDNRRLCGQANPSRYRLSDSAQIYPVSTSMLEISFHR